MNDIMQSVTDEVTQDWVEIFSDESNQNGFIWRMAAEGILPDGVNQEDDRVKELCRKAKESK